MHDEYNPCRRCDGYNCYDCRITKLKDRLATAERKLESAEFRIHTELEPRVKRERHAYDTWVSNPQPPEGAE